MFKHSAYWGKRLLVGGMLLSQLFTPLFAQSPCTGTVSCIQNGTLFTAGSGDMNSSAATTVANWWVSHGTPTIFGTVPPGGGTNSIWMWSYNGRGEGIFTCYSFQPNRQYRVCLWVRNTNANNTGTLQVVAANGLSQQFGTTIPTPASSQIIDNSFVNNGTWTQLNFLYTPNANYSQLWIYPLKPSAPNPTQYELQVDDIRVTEVVTGVTNSNPTIDWCGSSTLCVTGGPANATYTWSPAAGLSSTTGQCVTASPCSTTTYQVTVNGTANCPSCAPEVVNVTVTVNQPNITASNSGPVLCGQDLKLDAPYYPCATYTWYGPGGAIYSGSSVYIPAATSVHAGTYTLVVSYGGCTVTSTTDVVVDECPCEFRADFKWDERSCNPIFFFDNSVGFGTSVGWFWEFGDGSTSNLQNPVHIYPTAGVYKVCLTVIRKSGDKTCCDRICREIKVCDPTEGCLIIPDFSFSQLSTPPFTMQFTNLSVGNGIICSYKWDFGDGNSSSMENPVHVYSNPGWYVVCLTVTNCVYDRDGNLIDRCEKTICKEVRVDEGSPLLQGRSTGSNQDINKADVRNVNVYPNPATQEVMIALEGMNGAKVTIVSMNGAAVGQAREVSAGKFMANVQSLARGMYLVQVKDASGVHVVKFVKD